MKKTDTNLPEGILGFRQPYGGIDHVEQWQELSGSNDATIEIEELVKPPAAQKQGSAVEEKRT
jgi:hypothetical protein